MDRSDCFVLAPDVEVHSVEDGCVVFVPAADQVHFLNETAMVLLEHCDGRTDTVDLQAGFGDPGDVGFDVHTILEQFARAGIVVASADRPPPR